MAACARCGAPMPRDPHPRPGPPRRFCDARCRTVYNQRKRRGLPGPDGDFASRADAEHPPRERSEPGWPSDEHPATATRQIGGPMIDLLALAGSPLELLRLAVLNRADRRPRDPRVPRAIRGAWHHALSHPAP